MKFKSHFRFNKQERSGIFFLLLILVSFQAGYFYLKAKPFFGPTHFVLNEVEQAQLDSLRAQLAINEVKVFTFNPNFISDYKGYTLGMSPEELDRLHTYREQGKFINSTEEFQQVTQISDSLLRAISPLFKFPTWVDYRQSSKNKRTTTKKSVVVKDLNKVTAEELESVYGIGATLSKRIIKFRDRLGGFLVDEQLYDVYGLPPEVVQNTLRKFHVIEVPSVPKINLNQADVSQLSALIYIPKSLAYTIVDYRNANGPFTSIQDLSKVDGFPTEKLDRIALYLSL
ncbi:ComEA family DNA-binding protein [Flagellimonas sp. GZD32]|uniref:ComEA family DNA-binding protein n=1 Tax=Flagellimonas cixiensis TaxID=3228750 RepID=UPI0035C8F628